jgi:hypothetical protein
MRQFPCQKNTTTENIVSNVFKNATARSLAPRDLFTSRNKLKALHFAVKKAKLGLRQGHDFSVIYDTEEVFSSSVTFI